MSGDFAAALAEAVARLRAAGVPDPAGDARRLLAHAADMPFDRLSLHLRDDLSAPAAARFDAALAARLARRPVSQIIGYRLFWGRRFRVTEAVLDPRPETETVIAAALEAPFERLLDLGTGSGAIAATLLAERPDARGLATDLSAAALAVAAENATALGVAERLDFVQGDWFAPVSGRFDLIVSNPPYIAAEDIAGLAPEIRDWEPREALSPGGDGLDAYRAILTRAADFLNPGGRLLVEIGQGQATAVAGFFTAAGLTDVRLWPDLDGRPRTVGGCRG